MEVTGQIPRFGLMASIITNKVVQTLGIHGFDRLTYEGDAVFAPQSETDRFTNGGFR
jgi:hypothetical protein